MNLIIVHDNATSSSYEIKESLFKDETLFQKVGYIGTDSKEQNALMIFKAFFSNAKAILFDQTNKSIIEILQTNHIPEMTQKGQKTIFENHDFSFLYFTSGTTGIPVGALKSKQHLLSEVEVLTQLLKKYQIQKVIVTVPFIHLYGMLLGLLYPLLNDVDIIIKEHFLPHDLLELIEPNSMVVTTPLYIKALNKLNESKDLQESLFISSTAPLDPQDAKYFNDKFHSKVVQIFGSTETGGIAYKFNDEKLWTPFNQVNITTNHRDELHVESPFVSDFLYEKAFKNINGQIQTFDFIEKHGKQFSLIGRSSKIFKIAGKRYSTLQIENILESFEDITKALVFVKLSKDTLRGEFLDITIESQQEFTTAEIKSRLRKKLSNLKFAMEVKQVDKIPTNQVGKKLRLDS